MRATARETLGFGTGLEQAATVSVLAARVGPFFTTGIFLAKRNAAINATRDAIDGLDLGTMPFLFLTHVSASL